MSTRWQLINIPAIIEPHGRHGRRRGVIDKIDIPELIHESTRSMFGRRRHHPLQSTQDRPITGVWISRVVARQRLNHRAGRRSRPSSSDASRRGRGIARPIRAAHLPHRGIIDVMVTVAVMIVASSVARLQVVLRPRVFQWPDQGRSACRRSRSRCSCSTSPRVGASREDRRRSR